MHVREEEPIHRKERNSIDMEKQKMRKTKWESNSKAEGVWQIKSLLKKRFMYPIREKIDEKTTQSRKIELDQMQKSQKVTQFIFAVHKHGNVSMYKYRPK